ncbi:MAG: MFS transporter [Sandaracinaceae bacterium]
MTRLLFRRRFLPLFVTQLLGALNDNLFKSALVVTLTVGATAQSGLAVDTLVNMASVCLILPFFVFSALAGQLADKFDKATLIRRLKWVELGVMGLAVAGFWADSLPLLFLALALMGTQSAFFGPLKYGILPQHVEPESLLAANGLVEMATFVAILVGTLLGGLIVAVPTVGTALLAGAVLLVALGGVGASRAIPEAPPSAPSLALDWNLVRSTWRTVQRARRNRPAYWAILGASWFWFLGALILAQLPLFATQALGGDETTITALLAIFSVGIGIGSVGAERLGHGRIELGLVVPAGVLLMGLLIHLAHALGAAPGDGTIGAAVAFDLFGVGLTGGVFVVPLYALMQARSRPEERARIIAANNILNALFMVVAAVFAIGLRALGAELTTLLLATAALHAAVLGVAAVLTRDYLVRVTFRALVQLMYRPTTEGLDKVPEHGAGLVVCNHVSFADAFVLGGLCPRPIRFVMDHRRYRDPALNWLFRLGRAIPIAPRSEDPECLERAFVEIDRALAEGEVIGIFPEGRLTRDGSLGEFRPGVERILRNRPVPVVPVALRGLWGSMFSYEGGKPMKKWPRRLRARIEVLAGDAVAAERATADHLEGIVADLRGSFL